MDLVFYGASGDKLGERQNDGCGMRFADVAQNSK